MEKKMGGRGSCRAAKRTWLGRSLALPIGLAFPEFRLTRFTLRSLLLSFILIAVLAWLVFSSGLMARQRLYLISHLGQLGQEKRSVRYGIVAYREHLLLPGRKKIVAAVLVRPGEELAWSPDGRVVSATFDSFDVEMIDDIPHVVLQNMRVPFRGNGQLHGVAMTERGVLVLNSLDTAAKRFSFDEAMMFLQTARPDQWNAEEFDNWLESPESAGITPFPDPPYLVPGDRSKRK